jgi:hypothetical protein
MILVDANNVRRERGMFFRDDRHTRIRHESQNGNFARCLVQWARNASAF